MEATAGQAPLTTTSGDGATNQSNPADGQMEEVVFEMLPINVEPGQTHTLTEYDKRMKRAARFGMDPSQVAGPQFVAQANATTDDQEMDVDQAFDIMATGSGAPKVDKIKE